MRNVTIGDLRLYLRHLYESGGEELRASETGRLYEPRLRAKKDAIEALPESAVSRTPFAEELGTEDLIHDGTGTAVFNVCEAILAHPKLPAELKQTATTVRDTFIANLMDLRRSYADEAAAALTNRPKLAKQKAALKAVPMPGGGSLFDWVKAFLDSGDAIDALLRKRAHALATVEDASATGPLRGSTVGLLTRFRDALRDELADPNTKLPPDHEARLFAYLDKLSADRTAAIARRVAGAGGGGGAGAEPPVTGDGADETDGDPAAPPTGPADPLVG